MLVAGRIETTDKQSNLCYEWFRYGLEKRQPYSTTRFELKQNRRDASATA
jgi:hypothetical protein